MSSVKKILNKLPINVSETIFIKLSDFFMPVERKTLQRIEIRMTLIIMMRTVTIIKRGAQGAIKPMARALQG